MIDVGQFRGDRPPELESRPAAINVEMVKPWFNPVLTRIKPAFAAVVFVASVIHAALLTTSMVRHDSSNLNTPVNNFFRFVLISIGGLPVAAAVTVVLGVPTYLLVKATVGVNVASSILAGALIGLAVSLAFGSLLPTALISSPIGGVLIGAVSAAVWWLIASSGENATPISSGLDR
jgi:hypothetical protein